MKALAIAATVLYASLVFSGCARPSDLPGKWSLKVENSAKTAVANLEIEFTSDPAESCLGGDWKQVRTHSTSSRKVELFPVSEQLAYEIRDGQLTIGRTAICDAYLLLNGKLAEGKTVPMRGDYYSLGLGGSSPLGSFELSRIK